MHIPACVLIPAGAAYTANKPNIAPMNTEHLVQSFGVLFHEEFLA